MPVAAVNNNKENTHKKTNRDRTKKHKETNAIDVNSLAYL